jgi:hypothetical protein
VVNTAIRKLNVSTNFTNAVPLAVLQDQLVLTAQSPLLLDNCISHNTCQPTDSTEKTDIDPSSGQLY